jgi:hypothetical protein
MFHLGQPPIDPCSEQMIIVSTARKGLARRAGDGRSALYRRQAKRRLSDDGHGPAAAGREQAGEPAIGQKDARWKVRKGRFGSRPLPVTEAITERQREMPLAGRMMLPAQGAPLALLGHTEVGLARSE